MTYPYASIRNHRVPGISLGAQWQLQNLLGKLATSPDGPHITFLWKLRTLVADFNMNPTHDNQDTLSPASHVTCDCLITTWCRNWLFSLWRFGQALRVPLLCPAQGPRACHAVTRCSLHRTLPKSSFSLHTDTSPKGVQVNTSTNRLFWGLCTKKWVRGSWPIKIMSVCTVRCHF